MIANKLYSILLSRVKLVFAKNLKQGNGPLGPYAYTCPSIQRYPQQWLWDSCFHVLVASRWDIELAKAEWNTLFRTQHDSGKLGHMNYHVVSSNPFMRWFDTWVLQGWASAPRSDIVQPPFFASALASIWEHSSQKPSDVAFLHDQISRVARFFRWIRVRDFDGDHLLSILHPWASGVDDCPTYDPISPPHQVHRSIWLFRLARRYGRYCRKHSGGNTSWDETLCHQAGFFTVKDALLNSVFVQESYNLVDLASRLSYPEDLNDIYNFARKTQSAIEGKLWSPGLRRFVSLGGHDDMVLPANTFISLMPLYINNLDDLQVRAMISTHLLNPSRYWTPFPFPSVALDDPNYGADSHLHSSGLFLWRGATWFLISWIFGKALARRGYQAEAKKVLNQCLNLVARSGFREYYHPITGKGFGASNFTWGGLLLDLIDFVSSREE